MDLTRQTYGDVQFDKSMIRHRIFEYSGLTESEFRSLRRCMTLLILLPTNHERMIPRMRQFEGYEEVYL